MMFVAAGAVLEATSGLSWEQLIQDKILNPLGMTSSCFTDEQMEKTGNYATSYYEPDTTHRLAPISVKWQCEALGPAGTLRSNLEDMSHWMITQLNKGKYMGKAVFPEKVISQTLIPNNISDREGRYDELSHALYGLGRTMQTYKGIKIASHTGSIDGFYSNLTLIPQQGIAIFMVHNSSPAGSLRSVMTLPVIDLLLKQSYTPWSQRFRKTYLAEKKSEQQQRDSLLKTKIAGTQPSHALADYAGTFSSPIYGAIRIVMAGDQLTVHFRNFHIPIAHFHYDQFYNPNPNNEWPDLKLRFLTNYGGQVDRLSVNIFGDPVTEFSKQ
jgi:CubicO group peptidase (beta-lactamase class C family)